MPETRREAILQALMAAMQTLVTAYPGLDVIRNPQNAIQESKIVDLTLVLSDGIETLAPLDNARPGARLKRWVMSPKIEGSIRVRGAPEADRAAAVDLALVQLLGALGQQPLFQPTEKGGLLASPHPLADAQFDPYYTQTNTGFAAFGLTLDLTYDKITAQSYL